MKEQGWIDAHKGRTWPAILAMVALNRAWDNLTAWLYLGLHGSYNWLWVMKSRAYPDKAWESPAGLGRGLVIVFGLNLYWIAP